MIYMEQPVLDSHNNSKLLCTRLISTESLEELKAFAARCGWSTPDITREGRYDEHIRCAGREVINILKAQGAEELTKRKFRSILHDRALDIARGRST